MSNTSLVLRSAYEGDTAITVHLPDGKKVDLVLIETKLLIAEANMISNVERDCVDVTIHGSQEKGQEFKDALLHLSGVFLDLAGGGK